MNDIWVSKTVTAHRYQRYREAPLLRDRRRCREELEADLAAGVTLRTLYVGLFQRSLHQAGYPWERGQVPVVTVPLATANSTTQTLVKPGLYGQPLTLLDQAPELARHRSDHNRT